MMVFFFSSRRRHTRCGRDWSSDVCSSDLTANSVIGANDRESEDPNINFYLGQGLAARAFSYFNLVQLYQFIYVGNQSKPADRKSTRLNSSHVRISYAVFCLKKKTEDDSIH